MNGFSKKGITANIALAGEPIEHMITVTEGDRASYCELPACLSSSLTIVLVRVHGRGWSRS